LTSTLCSFKFIYFNSLKMSEMIKIKIETSCENLNQIESTDCIVNNIKKEPEVQFVLILPPRQVKIEKVEMFEEEDQQQNESYEKSFIAKNVQKHLKNDKF
jgi:hypothetical protein